MREETGSQVCDGLYSEAYKPLAELSCVVRREERRLPKDAGLLLQVHGMVGMLIF